MNEDRLRALEEVLGYTFSNRELIREALRHGSAAVGGRSSYERLEFLGDAVLGHAMALLLFERFPDADQGLLTRMRAHLTRSETLAQKTALLGLDGWVQLGPSEEMSRGRERTALLEDVLEAILGAVVLDGRFEPALDMVQRIWGEDLEEIDERTLRLADPKSALQEAAQSRGLPLPEYRQLRSTGPEHRLQWVFAVVWDGDEVARGEGTSKRDAQTQAARRALVRLGLV